MPAPPLDAADAPAHMPTPPASAGVLAHPYRRVLLLALPIIAANLTQPLLGAVDTAVAGHLNGAHYLGGVALGGLFFNFVYWGFGFLRMGTTGLVAQAYGAGDAVRARLDLLRALLLAALIGSVVLALRAPLLNVALNALGGSPAVRATALAYAQTRIWAVPCALANYVVLGYLLGLQRMRLALALQVFVNLVNAAAVVLFVYELKWGVAGIGAATAAADVAGCAFGALLLWRLRTRGLPRLDPRALIERNALARLVTLNRDIFIRTLCLLSAFGWFAHLGARQGDAILAANALLLNFQTFMAYGLDGFAQAAEALVGAAAGARNRAAFAQALRVTLVWSGIGALGFCAVYWASGARIVAALTDQPAVRAAAGHYLCWAALSPLVSVWGFLLDGVFIGATRTRALMHAMAWSVAIFLAAAWALGGAFGNDGLWVALLIFMAARGITLAFGVPALARAI